jgi:hypothetical protein
MSSLTSIGIPFDSIGKHEAIRLPLLADRTIYLHSQAIHQALLATPTL